MQRAQEDKMTKDEIIKYVDDLIKANERTYDKRITPLLYDFFLRANEKFNWSRQKFLDKYYNFKNNVKKIKFKRLNKDTNGCFRCFIKTIYIDTSILKYINRTPTKKAINYAIDIIFHECLHATDLTKDNGIVVKDRTL